MGLEQPIHLIEEENGVLDLRLTEGVRDVLLALADILGEQIAPLHDELLPIKSLPEILDEFGLARARQETDGTRASNGLHTDSGHAMRVTLPRTGNGHQTDSWFLVRWKRDGRCAMRCA